MIKLYIPNHIREIEVVNMMVKMLASYYGLSEEDYNNPDIKIDTEDLESFSDYKYNLKEDPVIKFINLCIPKTEENKDVYDSIVSYLSRVFYSVKGTKLVLDYIKSYLTPEGNRGGILNVDSLDLESNTLIVSLGNIEDKDVEGVKSLFGEFIDTLLYNRKVSSSSSSSNNENITIDGEVILKIESEITCYTAIYGISYKDFSAKE